MQATRPGLGPTRDGVPPGAHRPEHARSGGVQPTSSRRRRVTLDGQRVGVGMARDFPRHRRVNCSGRRRRGAVLPSECCRTLESMRQVQRRRQLLFCANDERRGTRQEDSLATGALAIACPPSRRPAVPQHRSTAAAIRVHVQAQASPTHRALPPRNVNVRRRRQEPGSQRHNAARAHKRGAPRNRAGPCEQPQTSTAPAPCVLQLHHRNPGSMP